MILKPIAKPVRIRIKSGGMEHSSVESLKSHFVVDDIKDLVADGRLSRWLEQQNHRSIPNDILDLNKDSMEFTLAVYRFFFDEKKEMSDGELFYCLYKETSNDAYLNKSAEEHFPKALSELNERREMAEEEARKKKEEARKKKEEYIMIEKGRYVELYKDCGEYNSYKVKLPPDSSLAKVLTFEEWYDLISHIKSNHPFCKKYHLDRHYGYFIYKTTRGYDTGTVWGGKFSHTNNSSSGLLLLFKDVEV